MKTKIIFSIVFFIISSVFFGVFVIWPLGDFIKLEFSIGILLALPFGIFIVTPLWILSLIVLIKNIKMARNRFKKTE